MRRLIPAGLVCVLGAAGCAETHKVIAPGPHEYVPPPASARHTQQAAASSEMANRVNTLGQKILTANPQVAAKVMFVAVGKPEPELFHVGGSEVWITEGLARQCDGDGPLAGLLCISLARLVAEREASALPAARNAGRDLPPLGFDTGGREGAGIDQTRYAELAKYDAERKRQANPLPPPDVKRLASLYHQAAGYSAAELAQAYELLKKADGDGALERQIRTRPGSNLIEQPRQPPAMPPPVSSATPPPAALPASGPGWSPVK